MMFFKGIHYLHYLWKARDQHAVHSPFVYKLLCLCIQKTSQKSDKAHQEKNSTYFAAIQNYLSPMGMAVTSIESESLYKEITRGLAENQCYFIPQNHKDKNSHAYWNLLSQNKNIQISIDFWSFGLIFTKKDQEKEHFVLFKNSWR